MIVSIIVLVISWFVGLFGWAQIIGSIQHRKERGIMTIVTILLWVAILFGIYALCSRFVPGHMKAFYIGQVISLIQILLQGRIN